MGRVVGRGGYRRLVDGGSQRRRPLERSLGEPRGFIRRRLRGSKRGSLRRVRRDSRRDGRGRGRDDAQQQVRDGGEVSKQLGAAGAGQLLQRRDQTPSRGPNVGSGGRDVPAEARGRAAASPAAAAAAPHPRQFFRVVPDVRLSRDGDGGVRGSNLFIRGVHVGARPETKVDARFAILPVPHVRFYVALEVLWEKLGDGGEANLAAAGCFRGGVLEADSRGGDLLGEGLVRGREGQDRVPQRRLHAALRTHQRAHHPAHLRVAPVDAEHDVV